MPADSIPTRAWWARDSAIRQTAIDATLHAIAKAEAKLARYNRIIRDKKTDEDTRTEAAHKRARTTHQLIALREKRRTRQDEQDALRQFHRERVDRHMKRFAANLDAQ